MAAPGRPACTICGTQWWCGASSPGTPTTWTSTPRIAVLATYLGRVEVRDVYWYFSAVPELMSIVAGRFEAFTERPSAGVS
jgi:hypothetical protein